MRNEYQGEPGFVLWKKRGAFASRHLLPPQLMVTSPQHLLQIMKYLLVYYVHHWQADWKYIGQKIWQGPGHHYLPCLGTAKHDSGDYAEPFQPTAVSPVAAQSHL